MHKPTYIVVKIMFISILLSISSFNAEASAKKKNGYLWYNLPKEDIKKPNQKKQLKFSQLNYQQRDKVLHFYTMEALHKARQTHSVKDMEKFLTLQNYWLNEASVFQHNFEIALINRPEFNFTVKHPTSSIGTRLNEERRSQLAYKSISKLTHSYGLMFFYEGNNKYSQRQAPVIESFARKYQFDYISVSVDGVSIPEAHNNRIDKGQAKKMHITSFPALVLVNPKTKQVMPVSHGFVTQDYLSQQFMVVASELKRQQQGDEVLYD